MSLEERYLRHVGRPGWHVDVAVEETDGNVLRGPEKDYYDLVAGWCTVNAGYGRDEIAEAAAAATKETAYVRPTYRNERIVDLAETLTEITPGDLSHVFRAPSGTESVELALKAARAYTGKETVVANRGSYHGHAMGALSLTRPSDRKPFEPTMPGVQHMPAPHEIGAAEWRDRFERFVQDNEVAAYVTEPVLTHHGARQPPQEHWEEIRRITRENDVVLVFDEVATGFGRTGELFAAHHYGVTPDAMTFAKGFSSGYAPMGAMITTQEIGQHLSDVGSTYATFGWTPDAVATAAKNIEIIREEDLAGRAAELGPWLADRVADLDGVEQVRQAGLMLGLELDASPGDVKQEGARQGVLLGTMHSDDYLLLSPPLNAEREFLEEGVARLEQALDAVR